MFFFSLLVFLLGLWFLPWWSLALISVILGIATRTTARGRFTFHVTMAGAVAWAALAFVQDGRSFGLISKRMSALFSLPSTALIFLMMATLGGVTVLLGFKAGLYLRDVVRTGSLTAEES